MWGYPPHVSFGGWGCALHPLLDVFQGAWGVSRCCGARLQGYRDALRSCGATGTRCGAAELQGRAATLRRCGATGTRCDAATLRSYRDALRRCDAAELQGRAAELRSYRDALRSCGATGTRCGATGTRYGARETVPIGAGQKVFRTGITPSQSWFEGVNVGHLWHPRVARSGGGHVLFFSSQQNSGTRQS